MFRGNRRFEVRREMADAGTLRPDDSNKHSNYMTPELLEELGQVGFDDYEEEFETDEREITLDENGCPVLPEGWTFLTHGSSLDRWDTSLLGNDFIVGEGMANGQNTIRKPLCCVERHVAKFDYDRSGANTAQSYGGKHQAFQIRVLYYCNPRTSDGRSVREKLSPEQISEINKCYMYQGGRHPAVPAGTKLSFLTNGDFDEITNSNGNNILWYIPEQYLEAYLDDVQLMQDISKEEVVHEEHSGVRESKELKVENILTNSDVEKELREFYSDDISIPELEEYLVQKIQAVYGDKLQSAGIGDVRKFLDGKLEDFEGASSYSGIVEELEDLIEGSKTYRKALDELNIGESQSNAIEQETNNQEFSPLLKGITGFDTPTEYTSAKVQSSEVYLRSKGSQPDKADKGIDR